jgi:pantothenate kinase-related protein Tda10
MYTVLLLGSLGYGASFFFLISQNRLIKRERGATHSTQDVYKGKPKREKIGEKENPKS